MSTAAPSQADGWGGGGGEGGTQSPLDGMLTFTLNKEMEPGPVSRNPVPEERAGPLLRPKSLCPMWGPGVEATAVLSPGRPPRSLC